jgi:hypothetical protein
MAISLSTSPDIEAINISNVCIQYRSIECEAPAHRAECRSFADYAEGFHAFGAGKGSEWKGLR